jgi:hypothetical protein
VRFFYRRRPSAGSHRRRDQHRGEGSPRCTWFADMAAVR